MLAPAPRSRPPASHGNQPRPPPPPDRGRPSPTSPLCGRGTPSGGRIGPKLVVVVSATVVVVTATGATTPLRAAVGGGATFFGAGAGAGPATAGAPRYWPELGSTISEDSSTASKAEAGTRLRSEMKPSSQLFTASPW